MAADNHLAVRNMPCQHSEDCRGTDLQLRHQPRDPSARRHNQPPAAVRAPGSADQHLAAALVQAPACGRLPLADDRAARRRGRRVRRNTALRRQDAALPLVQRLCMDAVCPE